MKHILYAFALIVGFTSIATVLLKTTGLTPVLFHTMYERQKNAAPK